MMPNDRSDLEEELIQWKETARQTLRGTSSEELRGLADELFPNAADPWAEKFLDLIAEHKAERAVRGRTSDQMEFIYYPGSSCGVWFERLSKNYAIGLLDQIRIKALSEIVPE
jgi:hypothetical protein